MGAAQQKAPDLVPGVVKDIGVPVWVNPLARVFMLVEVGAVKVSQPVLVAGKVGRYPVKDDADTALVQMVNQVHKVLRRTPSAGGGKISGGLVAP